MVSFINMELTLCVITFLWTIKMSSGIRCYLCDAEYSMLRRIEVCDNFNASTAHRFVTECPRSTMCSKRVTTFDTGSGLSTTGVQRGCAFQTTDGEQIKVNRGWEAINKVYEPYEEKCIDDPSNGDRVTKTLLCYCRGDLCNSGSKTPVIHATLLLTLGSILLGNHL